MGDNSLILGHRLGEYSSHGPYLEEDLAITNVALDHIGQAEALLIYAAEVSKTGKTADDLAYKRLETEYYNVQLVEQPNTDFAYIMARQFFVDAYNYFLYTALQESADETIAAIAAKSLKEVKYHLRRSSEWLVRLGKGTDESSTRMQRAIDDLWMYTGELFEVDAVHEELQDLNIVPDLARIKVLWDERVNEIFTMANLKRPEGTYMATGSRQGYHTEHMGFILAQMQYLPRAYPNATW